MTNVRKAAIEHAIEHGIREYFNQCQSRAPDFIRQHYRYPGCWQLNKHAFGFDLLRAPLNLVWAPVYVSLVLSLLILGFLRIPKTMRWAQQLPGGLTTRVQAHANTLIKHELLLVQNVTLENALGAAVVGHLEKLIDPNSAHAMSEQDRAALSQKLEAVVADALNQLMLTRTASADISNTVFSTAVGALAFKKFTPGGVGIGLMIAALWAKAQAQTNFFLGNTLGGWYYSIFPPQPDVMEISVSIAAVLCLLAVVASFSGLVTDPIQAHLGLHKYRLRKMLARLEKDVLKNTRGSFRPLDPYVARILELFDTLKAQFSF